MLALNHDNPLTTLFGRFSDFPRLHSYMHERRPRPHAKITIDPNSDFPKVKVQFSTAAAKMHYWVFREVAPSSPLVLWMVVSIAKGERWKLAAHKRVTVSEAVLQESILGTAVVRDIFGLSWLRSESIVLSVDKLSWHHLETPALARTLKRCKNAFNQWSFVSYYSSRTLRFLELSLLDFFISWLVPKSSFEKHSWAWKVGRATHTQLLGKSCVCIFGALDSTTTAF